VDLRGFEPLTSSMSMKRSNQLSYKSITRCILQEKQKNENSLSGLGGEGALLGKHVFGAAFLDIAPISLLGGFPLATGFEPIS
jgi:hypothetical protein